MEKAIVLYTLPAMGHLMCMVELGKLILAMKPSFSIQIIIVPFPNMLNFITTYISEISATNPSIYFHHLPISTFPSIQEFAGVAMIYELVHLANPHLHQVFSSISKSFTINAFILDAFCFPALSVASEFNIPAYFFFTGNAGNLAFTLYFPILHHQNSAKSFKDLKTFVNIPGLPPILSSDMPEPVLDRHDKSYEGYLNMGISLQKSAGIITNTFELLEPRVVKAISDGLYVPNSVTPTIYHVGPLTVTNNQTHGGHNTECLNWLDKQQNQSVIFLSFGSGGCFSKDQLREIAIGLANSGQKFLWVVRNPRSNDQNVTSSPLSDPDLNSLLPDGFLDRTKEKGLVVKSWAPQVAILNHKSVGGYVTHCGWNSILEAVSAGVPMVAWPLYSEQRFNRVMLVDEMKIALPINESENGFVTAMEVEKRVSELMDSELGKLVREQIIAMKVAANAASNEGGTSRVALSRLTESWEKIH